MKKSLFGYKAKEVDVALEALKVENEELNTKLTNVLIELAEAKKDAQRVKELEEILAEFETVKQENASLLEEIETVKANAVKETQDIYSAVGSICSKAYQDMDNVRANVANEIFEEIEKYESFVDTSNDSMKTEITAIRALYTEILDKLLNSTNEFVNRVKVIDESATELEGKIGKAKEISSKLKKDVNSSLKTPLSQPTFDAASILSSNAEAKEKEEKVVEIKETPRIMAIK
ncbi:MAG: hypothetical protein E7404_01110 [Ruminococcaceae bacterium]|nr:hypothetical protein [Oscillospiraceae bacterium]